MMPWIVLFSPLAAAMIITLFFLKNPKIASATALCGILLSLAASIAIFLFYRGNPTLMPADSSQTWFQITGFRAEFDFLLDRLSILMLLIVTGVGSCIFFYSIGYMKGDASTPRYFASLSLFAFSMLGIVLAPNFLMLFVFWELVAVSSYLLIGFWFEKPSAADAGNKAFIVNRVADFGLVLGILYVWMLSGSNGGERTFSFHALSQIIPDLASTGIIGPAALTLAALLVFCGVAGKSAQFPLYIWLPDAMEGPTPVSALIHAATMVAAGVYLMARCFFLVSGSGQALAVIAMIGGATALLAALLAVVQNDIKKILAYSTVSQLGFMVMALGLGGSTPAMFHLTTHAFFKALLFLGAGAMIHALHTQDIWEMGGLLKPMPVTSVTFLIGTLALCGIYPLSGFFSKDEILTTAYHHNSALFVLGLCTSALTAFYMSRACWVAILGPKRAHKHSHGHEHPHEAPLVMKAPLLALAALSIAAGFIGIPEFITGEHAHEPLNFFVAAASTGAALTGLLGGTAVYARLRSKEDPLRRFLGTAYELLIRKYYLDEFFLGIARFFQNIVAGALYWFDWNVIIQKGVNGAARLTAAFAGGIRRAQTGAVQTYAMVFSLGIVFLTYFVMTRS